MSKKTAATSDPVLLKLASYCAYQERCQMEVMEKLATLGVFGLEAAAILSRLIELGYVDEERFACIYAGSKFRVKKWGRIKIKQELKSRRISDYCIRKGLNEIEDEQYMQTLEELVIKKWNQLKSANPFQKQQKVMQFIMMKGFESDLIKEAIHRCKQNEAIQ